jgi:hypothetical protein
MYWEQLFSARYVRQLRDATLELLGNVFCAAYAEVFNQDKSRV